MASLNVVKDNINNYYQAITQTVQTIYQTHLNNPSIILSANFYVTKCKNSTVHVNVKN